MSAHSEFDAWRQDWQTVTPEPHRENFASSLREQTARQSRWQKIGLVIPCAVTLGIGWLLVNRAVASQRAIDTALAIEGFIFLIVVWAAVLWAARGTWRPLGETTSEFLALSIRRCRANLRIAPLAIGFYVGQLAVVFALIAWFSGGAVPGLLMRWPMILLGGIVLPALVVWGIFFHRRQKKHLNILLEIQRDLEDTTS